MNALMVEYLVLRRHEKDFIIRHDKAYVEESRAVLEKIQAADDKGVAENARLYVDTLARLAVRFRTTVAGTFPLRKPGTFGSNRRSKPGLPLAIT